MLVGGVTIPLGSHRIVVCVGSFLLRSTQVQGHAGVVSVALVHFVLSPNAREALVRVDDGNVFCGVITINHGILD